MNKPKALLIAEKKSVADDIKKVYNRIKETYPYQVDFGYCTGHLIELCYPNEYKDKDWEEWKKETLPIIPEFWKKKPIESKKIFLDTLTRLYKDGNYDIVINAGDSGREGQAIQTLVYEAMGVNCPIYRFWADDTTARTIEKALNNLKPNEDYKGLTDASILRLYLDWLCGINYSRAVSLSLNRSYSLGRVMTPTLAMIVNREKDIKNFLKEEYYELEGCFVSKETEYKGTLLNSDPAGKYSYRFNNRSALENIINTNEGVISQVEQQEQIVYAPTLFNLTDLQKECVKQFKFSPSKTLNIAQSLYEKHILSYPRTESRHLSSAQKDDINHILEAISKISEFSEITKLITSDTIQNAMRSKKYFDDTKVSDHPALTPTDELEGFLTLSEDEKNVFTLIIKRFLAILMPPKKGLNITVITSVENYFFKSVKNVILEKGFSTLYNAKEPNQELPNLSKGDVVTIRETNILEKETTPPKSFTLDTILTAMETAGKTLKDNELKQILNECSGLGTAATRSDILDKLITNEYVCIENNCLLPTQLGIDLINALGDQTICSSELTAKFEMALKGVEENHFPHHLIYDKLVKSIEKNTLELLTLQPLEKLERKIICQCPLCSSNVYESKKAYFCEEVLKDSEPCTFSFPKYVGNVLIEPSEFANMCKGSVSKKHKFTWKNGKKSSTQLCIKGDHYEFYKHIIGKCPKCQRNIIESENSLYCEGNTKNMNHVCDFSMYNKIGKTIIPQNIITEVLANGKSTKMIEVSFTSGKKNKGYIVINKENPQFFALEIPVTPICECPYCNQGTIEHKINRYKCSNNNCNFQIWDNYFRTTIPNEALKKILNGESIELKFKTKQNKTYSKPVTIRYNENTSQYEYFSPTK